MAPSITSVFPESGTSAGGTPVQIVGTGFTGTTGVTIDGNAVTMFCEVDDSNVLIITPSGTGTGDVVLTTGAGPDTLTDGFTYTNTTMINAGDAAGFMGAGVNAAFTITMQDLVGTYTEAFLCNLTKFDAVTNWGSINAIYRLMFSEYVARSIAVEAIKYDMNSYTSRVEAEDLVNIHIRAMEEILKLLNDASVQDFMGV